MENDRFNKAWKCLEPYRYHAKEKSIKNGMGLCVYKLNRNIKDGYNCDFWYADFQSREWQRLIKLAKAQNYMKCYSADKIAICVIIPDICSHRNLYQIKCFPFDENISFLKDKKNDEKSLTHRKNKHVAHSYHRTNDERKNNRNSS